MKYVFKIVLVFLFTFKVIGWVWKGLMEAVGTSRKLFELLDRQPVIQNDGFIVSNNLVGKIEFRNVKFNYPSRPDIPVLQVHF